MVRKKIKHYKLAGTVSDATGSPLGGVRVALPEFHIEDRTNEDGRFELQVIAESQRIVNLVAQKQGYQTVSLSPTLGDSGLSFALKRMP